MNTRVLVLFVTALWASAAAGQVGMPEVVITPVAHVGDPAPGILGATFDYFLAPQIDAAGNVLFLADLAGAGIDSSNYVSIYYGLPGAVELIAWRSDPAPDMGGEVVMESLVFADPRLSENGWIAFTADLAGPGIVEGVNDQATFVGPPGDIRKVLQGGDQAPGLAPGTYIYVGIFGGVGTALSDNATLFVAADLAGPGVDATNDRAYWTGTRDDLQLAWREGMPAPECEPGVVFDWADVPVLFNNAGQIAFLGGLAGSGVEETNNSGYWHGAPGALELIAREGDPAWGLGGAVLYGAPTGSMALTHSEHVGYGMILQGEGVTPDNNRALWYRSDGAVHLLGREGDSAPEIGPGVEVDSITGLQVNEGGDVFYRIRYRGDGIDESNEWAMYHGPHDSARLSLRDGEQAPHFPVGTSLYAVGAMSVFCALNDVGDVVAPAEIVGLDVGENNKAVLWRRHRLLQQWVPLLRGEATVGGRVVLASYYADLGDGYHQRTGGSDGQPQSLNDSGQLTIRLEFTDGSHGVYLIEPLLFGDADADGDVDLADWTSVQLCYAGPGAGLGGGCEFFDFDWDGDVDLADFAVFQRLFGGGE